MSGDTLTAEKVMEAWEKLKVAQYHRKPSPPTLAGNQLFIGDSLMGVPVHFSEAVPRDQIFIVSEPVFAPLGDIRPGRIFVLNTCHDPEQKRRYALLRESLTFLHRLVMG